MYNSFPEKIIWKRKDMYFHQIKDNLVYYRYEKHATEFWNGEGWLFNEFEKAVNKGYIKCEGAWYCHMCNKMLQQEGNCFCAQCDDKCFICVECGEAYFLDEGYEENEGHWVCNDCLNLREVEVVYE